LESADVVPRPGTPGEDRVQHTYADGSHSFTERSQQLGTWSDFIRQAHATKGATELEGGDAVTIRPKGSEPNRLKPVRDGHQVKWHDLLAAAGRTKKPTRLPTGP
jgi:hypothetical protein